MMLGYRAVFRLPDNIDAIDVVNQEIHSWLEGKLRGTAQHQLRSGELLTPGVHEVSDSLTVTVVRADHAKDGSKRQFFRLNETNKSGQWEVTVHAFALPNSPHKQSLTIEVERTDDPTAQGEVDPPRLVRQLLDRDIVKDGAMQLSAEPRLIRPHQIDDVIDAILDEGRTASVIVAASLDPDTDEALRLPMRSLTSRIVGVAATFVVASVALDELNQRLGASHRIQPGRVRTFLPGVEITNTTDALRHRILGPVTFARAIHGNSVSRRLQSTFAVETRSRLLANELPGDIRRGTEILQSERTQVRRTHDIEKRVLKSQGTSETSKKAPLPTAGSQPARLTLRIARTLQRWLGVEATPEEHHLDLLDSLILRERATSETVLNEAAELERRLEAAHERARESTTRVEDLEIAAAEAEQEAREFEEEVYTLRQRLIIAGHPQDTVFVPAAGAWEDPEDISELVARIAPKSPHQASTFVQFTGDENAALEVQQRDPIGRYARAFWQYIHVLHDYAQAKASGNFAGNVHGYLTDDRVLGTKCSPTRHAARESEQTMQQWGGERIFAVPIVVADSGSITMDAHFKPTHRDTFAPRLHYFDDTDGTGKIYVGYIGRHLTNTHTKNS